MAVGRRLVAGFGAALVVASGLGVPPLADPVRAAPPGVDDDVSVAAQAVPVGAAEPNPAELDTAMTAPDVVEVVWPGAGSAAVEVPVAVGRSTASEVAPVPAAAGVSVLADGAATEAVRPGDGLAPDRAGPGPLPARAPAELGGLTAGGLSQVRVSGQSRAAAQALGVAQVFTVERVDGSAEPAAVDVRVDYSGYAGAFGGSYADRLRLVRLPGCAVTEPSRPECSAVPVPVEAVNNPSAGTLTARLPVSGDLAAQRRLAAELGEPAPTGSTVFAVTSSGQGASTGDYEATDLNPGGTWQVGLSSGAFTYSYPVPEPPLLAGSGLELSLNYDSQSVDAFTQSTNNQSGWVGLGWDLSPGYIERKFRHCREDIGDGSPKERSDQQHWGDLCWESPDQNDGESDTTDYSTSELYLSLHGVSTRIVKDRVSGEWKTERDFGWEIELIAGGSGKDYWQISTLDGSLYRFGYTDGSNLWVPVVGDDPGEPQYANYPVSYQQTWRWNLDRVRDPNENEIHLHWAEETNYYQRWLGGGILSYDRGAHLTSIGYGTNPTVTGSVPTGKVEFVSLNRCVEATVRDDPVADPYVSSDCPAVTVANASSYPDVPVDLICGSSSCAQFSPTFFSTKRLERVTTWYWNTDLQVYHNIYRLQLRFKTVNPPGLTGRVLWLDRIFPVGLIGLDTDKLRLPGVNFDAQLLSGRVDYDEPGLGVSEMILPRVYRVYNGYGGRTDVTYGHVAPCPTSGSASTAYQTWYAGKAGKWDLNTDECAPVWYKPEGAPAGWGQFHKYLALQVVDFDLVGGSPSVVTSYEYRGDAAWALGYGFIDSQGLTESWNEWRGYSRVRVHTGSGSDPDDYSVSGYVFFRGLYYDFLSDWQTHRKTTLTNYDGQVYSDVPGRAGQPLQVRHYQMTAYHSDPSQRSLTEVASSKFAYRWANTGDGPGLRNPYFGDRYYESNRAALAGGGWRADAHQGRAFDEYGLPTELVDWGDSRFADNTCTTISYARLDQGSAGTHYLIDYPETMETWSDDACGTGDVISRTVTFYDGFTTVGAQEPYDGNPTRVRTYTSLSGFVTASTSYDSYGRVTSATDQVGKTTSIAYSPAVNWPTGGVTTTNPAGHASTTVMSPSYAQPNWVVDANGKRTDLSYDQLGRPVEVFLPGDPESAGIESMRFDYAYTWDGTIGQPTAATRVGTHTLRSKTSGGQYLSSYVFDDGFGRIREAQAASPAGGRVVEASGYDPRGLTAFVSAPFHNAGQPGAGLVNPATSTLPSWTRHEYDGLGRSAAAVAMALSAELWRSTIEYRGDHTITTPPEGAAPVTVFRDVNGNPTLRQEHLDGGGTVDTAYQWDRAGRLAGVLDDAGNQWSYGYDLAGRRTSASDPDAGDTSYGYDAAGRLVSSTDARGETVSTSYDSLGRPSSRWDGPVNTGTLLAQWSYDSLAAGQPSSATRWHGGDAYTTSVAGYNERYQPVGMTVSIPSSEGPLSGSYDYGYGYTDAGWAQSVTLPAAGGLPAETVSTSYTPLGLADRLTSDFGGGGVTYVHATAYDKTGDLVQQLLGAAGARVARDLAWDEATGRLSGISTVAGADTAGPVTVQDDGYAYDPAGNVLSIADAVTGQAECFAYDELRRLVQAWTVTTAQCAAGPSAGVVAGPDPYWHSWSFDSVGNRLTQTEHAVGGAGEVSTTYSYPPAGGAAPHSLVQKSVTDPSGTVVTGYQYDPAGNTIGRPDGAGEQQTLSWDAEGHLAAVSDPSGTSEYVYDPDGNRLVAHHADGSAVLYLPAGVEVHADPSGITSCYRYYGDVAVRTNGGLDWLAADHHGTGTLAVDADDLSVTQRHTDPYGNPRGQVIGGVWPDDKGFLGAPVDPAGLTHLGAREYDPLIGRFISVDPIMDLTDPQQMHGYTYAASNPLTFTDPSGLSPFHCTPDADSLCAGQNPRTQPAGRPKSKPKPKPSGCRDMICRPAFQERHGGRPASKPAPTRPRAIVSKVLQHGTTYVLRTDGRIVINGVVLPAGAPPGAELAPLVDQVIHDNGLRPDEVLFAVSWLCDARVIECEFDFLTATWTGDVSPDLDANSIVEMLTIGGAMSVIGQLPGAMGGRPGSRARRSCGNNSFEEGTLVLMADGTHKPIEDIEVGDLVLATDPETGLTEPQPVIATIAGHGNKTMVEVTVAEGRNLATPTVGAAVSSGGHAVTDVATVRATDDHPFWVANQSSWVEAEDLRRGDRLVTATNGHVLTSNIELHQVTATVHNLTVAQVHTYYVLTGVNPILVHNTGPSCSPMAPGAGPDWVHRTADNGKGQVWQRPGATGNADMVRVMDPTSRYPNGYVRFYNKYGQPVGLDGKPGPNSATHIPRRPDGTYPLPSGWS